MKTQPLNPLLYRLLKERFRSVKVSNQGVAQIAKYAKQVHHGSNSGKEWFLNLIEPGEYYQVCCPYCNDTRHRLYFNHRWGVRDEEGFINLWMAICYNENCLHDYERRRDLYEELTANRGSKLETAVIKPGVEIDPSKVVMDWPGPVTRVDKLPRGHKAVQYLLSRDFDPEKIGRFYNVHYCHASFRWMAQDRLIIPVYRNKVMCGWQARYVGELPWYDRKKRKSLPPKYYTCPGTPRRSILYNFANASQYETGVIVEGPSDVWGFGPMCCCTLGSTMTVDQRKLFHSAFRKHSAILLFDPDAWDKPGTQKIIEVFEGQFAKGFAAIKLPDGRDPGSMDREFARDFVAQEAKAQGVKVSWRKR